MARSRIVLLTQVVVLLGAARVAHALSVGETAPPVEPSEWINTKGSVSWSSFRGHLILVEKWATWCGPCRESIPHLIKLHDEYGKKGLVVIGVSDEQAGTVKPFVEKNSMSYIIALGGANGYQTNGIPHGWLVGPDGKVVWEGHPASLTNATIDEHIRGVRLAPTFKLPKELKSAHTLLEAGKFGQGLKELERAAQKSGDTQKPAQEAIAEIKKYGESKLEDAANLAKEKDYPAAIEVLASVEKGFSGHELGAKAKTARQELAAKPEVKLQVSAEAEIEKARDLIKLKKYKPAAAILRGITESKKLMETKAHAKAMGLLRGIQNKI